MIKVVQGIKNKMLYCLKLKSPLTLTHIPERTATDANFLCHVDVSKHSASLKEAPHGTKNRDNIIAQSCSGWYFSAGSQPHIASKQHQDSNLQDSNHHQQQQWVKTVDALKGINHVASFTVDLPPSYAALD